VQVIRVEHEGSCAAERGPFPPVRGPHCLTDVGRDGRIVALGTDTLPALIVVAGVTEEHDDRREQRSVVGSPGIACTFALFLPAVAKIIRERGIEDAGR